MEKSIKINAISSINKMRMVLDELETTIREDKLVTPGWWNKHYKEGELLYGAIVGYNIAKKKEL